MTVSSVPAVIWEMVRALPSAGTAWPEDQRELWLGAITNILKLTYPPAGTETCDRGALGEGES